MSIHRELAGELRGARLNRTPVSPISSRYPDMTGQDGYLIQRILREMDEDEGDVLVGFKVGGASAAIRREFNLTAPHFGYVTEDMILASQAELSVGKLMLPLVEGEVGFILNAELPGHGTTPEDVWAATTHLVPTLEVLDSCTADWAIEEVDIIADNSVSRYMVLGDPVRRELVQLENEEMILTVDGETRRGRSTAVLGDPAESVAWLARALAEQDERLGADNMVFAGAWAEALKFGEGSSIEATFTTLGKVVMKAV
ncbi:2-keto-4-pentenoate hydratase [Amycolatopsis alba]|uniref:2-keto-4-pentenoate hydratase n=1 Tax=Amycolatopsis alba DSM 44262 TaxID=1125972 RepID=A0A229RLK0_AMYAL|nr:hypothetical protein [Amycolatopsis alba]OXM47359.1 2-keto-4-pentenoate hydratase [Amycolatopsis alba DSM 44262]